MSAVASVGSGSSAQGPIGGAPGEDKFVVGCAFLEDFTRGAQGEHRKTPIFVVMVPVASVTDSSGAIGESSLITRYKSQSDRTPLALPSSSNVTFTSRNLRRYFKRATT
jgi:hypothetical protein